MDRSSPDHACTDGISFAVLTSAVSTVLLWNLDTIKAAFGGRKSPPDRHVEAQERHYQNVPTSWYLVLMATMLGAATFLMLSYPLQMPVWGVFMAVGIAAAFLVPCGVIAATTNTTIGLNVVTEVRFLRAGPIQS